MRKLEKHSTKTEKSFKNIVKRLQNDNVSLNQKLSQIMAHLGLQSEPKEVTKQSLVNQSLDGGMKRSSSSSNLKVASKSKLAGKRMSTQPIDKCHSRIDLYERKPIISPSFKIDLDEDLTSPNRKLYREHGNVQSKIEPQL